MTWRDAFHQSPLARRLIFWTVLFSSCVTLILTGLQLYRDYRQDISQIEQNLSEIDVVHRATLTDSLWATDQKRLQLQLEGMLRLRDMQYLEVREGELVWAYAGSNDSENIIQREITLGYQHDGREQILGTLVAVATLDHVYARLLGEAVTILMSNGIKTFLVAVFMLLLIYFLITRHLLAISRFARQFDLMEPMPLLRLERTPRADELGTTVDALNHMHERLNEFLAKIAESEERFRFAFEQAAVGIAHVAQDGHFLRVNQKLCHIVGYTQDELNARTFQDITHPDDLDADLEQVRRVLAGKLRTYSMEKRYFHKDGRVVWINLTVSLVRKLDGTPDYFISVIEDITQRLRAEQALRAERDFTGAVLDTIGSIVVVLDRDGRIVRFNRACEQITGFSADEVLGRHVWDFLLPPEQIEPVKQVFAALTAGQFPNAHENDWFTRGGERRMIAWSNTALLDASGGVEYVIATGIDITARQEAEQRLAGASEQLHELLTNMADGFVRLDRDWHYTFVNKRAGQMFGRPSGELVGRNIWEEFPEGIDQPFYHAYHKAMADQQPAQIQSYYAPWGKWFENRIYPSADGISIFFDDITERRRAEDERENLLSELTARNAEMENFVYTISHDLKSPLITIGGFSTLLIKDIVRGDSEAVADSISEIRKAVELMQTHISDLLLLSRTGRASAERTDLPLGRLLEEVVGQFGQRIADRGARVLVASDLPVIRVDRKGMLRVYTNLIDNALKYSRPDSVLNIEVGWRRENRELQLFVRDNGRGIKREYQQRIFGLFQRADSEVEGTGVGLAISKRVIEVHGGRMWVESVPGQGSTFWIGLPEAIIVEGRE